MFLLDFLDGVSYYVNPDIINYLFIEYQNEYVICYDQIGEGFRIVYDHNLYVDYDTYHYTKHLYPNYDYSAGDEIGNDECELAHEDGVKYLGVLKIIDDPKLSYFIPDTDLISNISDDEGYSIFINIDKNVLVTCARDEDSCQNYDCANSSTDKLYFSIYIRLDPKLYRLSAF